MDVIPDGPNPIARPIFASAIPSALASAAIPLDSAGRIDTDLPCRRCGYNLRGLLPDGRCPECATAVGRSMHGDYLKFADPAWVEKLASGINWIVGGSIIGMLIGAGAGGMMVIFHLPHSYLIALMTVLGLITTYGYWRVTTPDPSGFGEAGRINARQLTRATTLINYVMNPLLQIALRILPSAGLIMTPVLSLIGLVGTFAMFRYARQLALRIPDPAMAKGFRTTMWGMVVITVLGMLTGIAGYFFAGGAGSGAGYLYPTTTATGMTTTTGTALGGTYTSTTVFGSFGSGATPLGFGSLAVIGCVTSVCVLVFGIWSLVLVLRLRKALNQASEQALHTWAAIPVGQSS